MSLRLKKRGVSEESLGFYGSPWCKYKGVSNDNIMEPKT